MYPRKLAIRVLTRVLSDKEPLDEALAAMAGEADPSKRGWLQEVCSGTLRWKGRLDFVLDSVSLKKKPSGWLRKALLLAAYQLVVQERTAPAGVVSETVTDVASKEGEAPAKFANAVLRKIADHAEEWRTLELPENASLEEGARWASLPTWFWKKLVEEYGIEWARSFASATLERPKLWVAARSPHWQPDWAVPGPVPNSWESVGGGAVQDKSGFTTGDFIVQDISSQLLISEICKQVRSGLGPQDLTALDLCAAPGGKTAGVSWKGFSVTASDIKERRLELLRSTVQRVAPDVKVIPPEELASLVLQDFVWVDAPCSGTGIVRRHPDVRWLREEREFAALNRTQDEVLKLGWSKVKPGGFLAYSVCSVFKGEGPGAIGRAGIAHCIVGKWFLLPHEFPFGDGFWAALLRKQ